jgi:hypothetical protein
MALNNATFSSTLIYTVNANGIGREKRIGCFD